MYGEYEEPNIIELDDPVPHGALMVGVMATIVIFALIVAPFVITLPGSEVAVSADEQTTQTTDTNQVCRPDINVPAYLDDIAGFALPSWMRMCDWFIPPDVPPVNTP